MLNHKNAVWAPKLDFVEGACFDSGFGVGLQLGDELALVLILLLSVCNILWKGSGWYRRYFGLWEASLEWL